jgi:hypothetical protein
MGEQNQELHPPRPAVSADDRLQQEDFDNHDRHDRGEA